MVVDRLYYNAGEAPEVATSINLSGEVLMRALENIYSRRSRSMSAPERNLFDAVSRRINEGISKGVEMAAAAPGSDFVKALRHSADVFSAFKVHRAQSDMARLLLDSNGNLKPFEQWLKDVMPIASHQMGPWLRTEYNTAVIRAHQAADWQRFLRERDILPNLEWIPSTSVTPGLDHRPFWGVVRPVEDTFWTDHRPGDRWNCKCSLRATDSPATAVPDNASGNDAPQPGLSSNPGTSGEIFSDDHPYFPADCASCPFNTEFTNRLRGFFGARRKKDCQNCSAMDKELKRISDPLVIARQEYYALKHNSDYRDVRFDKKSGGVTATHVGHNTNTGKKEFFNNTMSGADLERECTEQLFKSGHKVILCDESKELKPGNKAPAIDMQLDGVMMDIRSITGKSRWYVHPLLAKNSQLKAYNARPDVTEAADAVCLYFHNPGMFDEGRMLKSIKRYKFHRKNDGMPISAVIKWVYVVLNGRSDILKYPV